MHIAEKLRLAVRKRWHQPKSPLESVATTLPRPASGHVVFPFVTWPSSTNTASQTPPATLSCLPNRPLLDRRTARPPGTQHAGTYEQVLPRDVERSSVQAGDWRPAALKHQAHIPPSSASTHVQLISQPRRLDRLPQLAVHIPPISEEWHAPKSPI